MRQVTIVKKVFGPTILKPVVIRWGGDLPTHFGFHTCACSILQQITGGTQ